MTRKLLSLVTATGIVYVYLLSQLRSADALFLVTSDNLAVNIGLLALGAFAVYISFLDRFTSRQTYAAALVLAILCGGAGFIGFGYAGLDNYFSGLIKPLDYMVLMQLGIIMGICALSYKHQPLEVRGFQYGRMWLGVKQQLSSMVPKPEVSASHRHKPRAA